MLCYSSPSRFIGAQEKRIHNKGESTVGSPAQYMCVINFLFPHALLNHFGYMYAPMPQEAAHDIKTFIKIQCVVD